MRLISSSRPARRLTLLGALTLTLLSLTGSSSAAVADFTWSGGAPLGSPNWSNPANWAGGVAPSNSVGTLSFPLLTSAACTAASPTATCYSSSNDLSGLGANAISIDDGAPYNLTGSSITLGAGGITAAPLATPPPTAHSPYISLPITLTAPQTWSITGGTRNQQLGIGANVTGQTNALRITFAGRTFLDVSADVEVGAVTATGLGVIAIAPGVNGLGPVGGSLNGTDGQPVTLSAGAGLFASGVGETIGPLTVTGSGTGGGIQVGTSGVSGTITASGAITLDSTSNVSLYINRAGTTAGTAYSQLGATGALALANARLTLGGANASGGCPALHPGDVDTLLSAGSLSGTFAGVPDGTTLSLACTGTAPQVRINYTATTVTATVLTVGGQPSLRVFPGLGGSGSGTVTGTMINCPPTCSASYPVGTTVTLTATPSTGSTFTGWGGACSGTGPCSVTMNSDQEVTATFSGSPTSVPTNNFPPTISGTATQGQTLSETNGMWTNGPTSFAYQWQDCDSAGNNCAAIAGATGQTYTLTASDVGHTVRVQETASNAVGPSSPTTSAATGVVVALVPSNTSPPTISGAATQGQTLTEANGAWSNSPTSFAYQWLDCDSAGNNCTAISGATSQTYTMTASDVGQTIRVQETASNSGGAGSPVGSAATAPVGALPPPPANTALPTITGTAAQGQMLTERNGSWTNSPTSFVYQWQTCDGAANNCAAIAGATGQTYVLAAGDVGHTIRVQESATNAGGTGGPVASAATAVVAAPTASATAPANAGAPSIVGSAAVGATLGCRNGFWSGSTPQTYAFQWLRDTTPITGATGDTYTIVAADGGHALACRVTASNSAGSASAASTSVTPAPESTRKTGAASVASARAKGTAASALVTCTGVAPQTCTITLELTVRETLKRGKVIALSASKRTVGVGRTTVTIGAGQGKTVVVKLNRTGRRLLASRHTLPAKLKASQTTSSGPVPIGSAQTITFQAAAKKKKKAG